MQEEIRADRERVDARVTKRAAQPKQVLPLPPAPSAPAASSGADGDSPR
jgi:hypothetical protein